MGEQSKGVADSYEMQLPIGKRASPFEIEENPNILCDRHWRCGCCCDQNREVLYASIDHGIFGREFFKCDKRGGNVSVTVTNCSRWQITYWPRIEVKEFGLWPPYPNNVALDDLAKPRKISPYASDFILVSPPTNVSAWRLWVDYRADTERNKAVHKAQAFFEKIHLEGLSSKIIPWDLGGYVLLPKSDEPLNREAEIDKGSCGPKMARGATTP